MLKQRRILSALLFSVYLDDLLCEFRQFNGRCHNNKNCYVVGAVIYADDIPLLGPSRSSILSMLMSPETWIIQFYIFLSHPNSLPGLPLHFINTDIVFVHSYLFLSPIMIHSYGLLKITLLN